MEEFNQAELKQFYDNVKDRYTKAKKVLDNIDSLAIRYAKADESVQAIVSEVGETKNETQALQSQAKLALDQIQEVRTDISGYLEAAKVSIDKLQELKTSAAALEGLISGGKGEIEALLQNARNLTDAIEKNKITAENNLTKSNDLLADFQQKVELMKTAYAEFLEIKKKIDDKGTGLNAALQLVQEAQTASSDIVGQIKSVLEASSADQKKIAEIKETSVSYLEEIKSSLVEVNSKKSQVEEAAAITIDGSFAGKFESRKNEIENNLNKNPFSWKFILLGSVALLTIAVSIPFIPVVANYFSLGEGAGIEGFIIRIFYTSPLVFLVAFSATQYSRERNLLERYAFKAAAAAAIRNHTEFLLKHFTAKEAANFTLGVFTKIYGEPFREAQPKESSVVKETEKNKKRKEFDTDLVKELSLIINETEKLDKILNIFNKRI